MEKIKEIKISENANSTDPKVVFDPTFERTTIAKNWKPQADEASNNASINTYNKQVDNTRIDGIIVPIIKINTQVIPSEDVQYMRFYYTSFKPYVEVIVRKSIYLKFETPGMANKMTVVMLPPVDGTYKKISVDFYIVSVSDLGNSIKYCGNLFFPQLELKTTRSLKYEGKGKMTTWELLNAIAAESTLGFACTDMCKNVNDSKVRLVRDQNLQEVIKEHIRFGGTDNTTIFDAWIDVYGYLVMMNISWVLSKSVSPNELSIKKLKGLNIYDNNATQENSISYGEDTFRTFTNWKQNVEKLHNGIERYEWIINNNSIKFHGTDNTYYIIESDLNNNKSNIVSETVQLEDSDVDGKNYKDAYRFQNNSYIGAEMGLTEDGNCPILFQQQRHDAFFAKLQAKRLKVVLKDNNIGLQRGMLINLMIYEYDRQGKEIMLKNADNLKEGGDQNIYADMKIDDIDRILNDSNVGIPNLSVSGIYYIDGIEWMYDSKNPKISQILYLVKQTRHANYYNMSSVPKIDRKS